MRIPIADCETGKIVGLKEIPDDILNAAAIVQQWLIKQPDTLEIHGLVLAEPNDQLDQEMRSLHRIARAARALCVAQPKTDEQWNDLLAALADSNHYPPQERKTAP